MLQAIRKLATKTFAVLEKEQEVAGELHADVKATLERMQKKDPGLRQMIRDAHAYAVFPSVGKAALVVGGSFGKGEVFEEESLIGYAAIAQLTLGVQLGGETFSQLILFENLHSLARFKQNRLAFAANASVAMVKAGAAATARYEKGVTVFLEAEGGMMLELAIGAQKFIFKPALLERGRKSSPARAFTRSNPGPRKAVRGRAAKRPRRKAARRSRSIKSRGA